MLVPLVAIELTHFASGVEWTWGQRRMELATRLDLVTRFILNWTISIILELTHHHYLHNHHHCDHYHAIKLVTNERRVVILGPAPDRELQWVLGELDWSVAEKVKIMN